MSAGFFFRVLMEEGVIRKGSQHMTAGARAQDRKSCLSRMGKTGTCLLGSEKEPAKGGVGIQEEVMLMDWTWWGKDGRWGQEREGHLQGWKGRGGGSPWFVFIA